ncbi:hypothetical protein SISSUDRAFT_1067935 [Sistotremastrum suecicum HHB10207 ss-3]|uniref:Uncharacterized protein n=1 Tax=Sistotremastrum suecicum HHB10207 ss-3 TaxID=1314776 RepID=A0A165WJS1_9AGAM|nr:hypothetical protein SISSUDRAFT_1067935 [Sistotremastrum suecicum HHB10207 ss-3]
MAFTAPLETPRYKAQCEFNIGEICSVSATDFAKEEQFKNAQWYWRSMHAPIDFVANKEMLHMFKIERPMDFTTPVAYPRQELPGLKDTSHFEENFPALPREFIPQLRKKDLHTVFYIERLNFPVEHSDPYYDVALGVEVNIFGYMRPVRLIIPDHFSSLYFAMDGEFHDWRCDYRTWYSIVDPFTSSHLDRVKNYIIWNNRKVWKKEEKLRRIFSNHPTTLLSRFLRHPIFHPFNSLIRTIKRAEFEREEFILDICDKVKFVESSSDGLPDKEDDIEFA